MFSFIKNMSSPAEASVPAPVPAPVPAETLAKPTKTKRTSKSYTVAIETPKLRSYQTISRSGPTAAASHAVRSHISSLPLKESHKVWVKSHNKFHPYSITRDYDNPKLRRFSIKKSGPSLSSKEAKDPAHAVPADFFR